MKRQRGVNNNNATGNKNKFGQPSIIDAFAVFADSS
jgi:hypothetical protein